MKWRETEPKEAEKRIKELRRRLTKSDVGSKRNKTKKKWNETEWNVNGSKRNEKELNNTKGKD